MARDLNQVVLSGRLTQDSDVRYKADGTPMASFSLAVNGSYMQGEQKQHVSFFDVVAWGNLAQTCERFLQKGAQIAISARLKQSRWQDPQTGASRSKVMLTADFIKFLELTRQDNTQRMITQTYSNQENTTSQQGQSDLFQQSSTRNESDELQLHVGDLDGGDDIPF
jgi:single-strand DNA-binding protein